MTGSGIAREGLLLTTVNDDSEGIPCRAVHLNLSYFQVAGKGWISTLDYMAGPPGSNPGPRDYGHDKARTWPFREWSLHQYRFQPTVPLP